MSARHATPRRAAGRGALLALATLLATSGLSAQTRTDGRARSCAAGDARAAWHRAQRAWMRDSSDGTDPLRASLAAVAATLREERDTAPQLGARLVDSTSLLAPAIGATDASRELVARLTLLARDRQAPWPTRSLVGPRGVRTIYLLAESDTAFARAALHRMMEAGPEESFAPDVATLEDELRLRSGRKQLYATHLRATAGGIEPYPTEDLAHVDMRREAASLPPLARALCEARRGR